MEDQKGAVLITGASSGIGEATARLMAERGYTVFAGYRKNADAERLKAVGERLIPVRLDVADEQSMSAAREFVEATQEGRPLRGLINNAGLAVPSFFELIPLDQLRFQFEVNFFGAVRMIQLFLPLIRNAPDPRIINVSSIIGRFAAPVLGPYSSSKFAMEALSDTLRVELREWGVQVVTIEPGKIATNFARNAETKIPHLPEGEELAEPYRRMADRARSKTGHQDRGISPKKVAEVIEAAIGHRRPRPRYLVGGDAKMMAFLRRVSPDRLFDRIVAAARG
jgi:NAD(P)-dependent dehydrogenase (short-subunit alcohol dehydrogenase family)